MRRASSRHRSRPVRAFGARSASSSARWSGRSSAALLLYPVFQAMLLRWWASGLRFGEVTADVAPAHRTGLRRLSALHRLVDGCSHGRRHRRSACCLGAGRRALAGADQHGASADRDVVRRHRRLCRDRARLFGHLPGQGEARLCGGSSWNRSISPTSRRSTG